MDLIYRYIKDPRAFLVSLLIPSLRSHHLNRTKGPSIVLLDPHHGGSAIFHGSTDLTTPNPSELAWAPVLDCSTSHPCHVEAAPLYWSPHQIGAWSLLSQKPHQIGAAPLHWSPHEPQHFFARTLTKSETDHLFAGSLTKSEPHHVTGAFTKLEPHHFFVETLTKSETDHYTEPSPNWSRTKLVQAPVSLKGSPCCNPILPNHGSELRYCFTYINIYSIVSVISIFTQQLVLVPHGYILFS